MKRARIGVVALTLLACAKKEAPLPPPPPLPEPVAAPAPPPPLPPVVDAAVADAAAADAVIAAPAAKNSGHHRGAPAAEPATKGAIGKLTVQGTVPRADVDRTLHAAVAKLKACHGGKGTVDLGLTIGERGFATFAEVKRSSLPQDAELCLVNALRALRFPRPTDGADTTVAFVLQLR